MSNTDNPRPFEAVPCTRCGGDPGAFRAFGHVNDGKCLKCDGTCWSLTKRGAAAQRFFEDLKRIAFADLKPGMLVRPIETNGARVTGQKMRIASVNVEEGSLVDTSGCGHLLWDKGRTSFFRVIPKREEKEQMLAQALAYQATLTKQGTPKAQS